MHRMQPRGSPARARELAPIKVRLREIRMRESERFLKSLLHENPLRPRFTIQPAEYETLLEIQHQGQRLEVPISEVLAFAARWQADRDERESQVSRQHLPIHPYPLYNMRMNDPDRAKWWVPDE